MSMQEGAPSTLEPHLQLALPKSKLSSFGKVANAVVGWLCVMVGLVVFWVFLAPWVWAALRWLAYSL